MKLNLAKSFPEIAKQWHPTKNGDLKPCDFISGSIKPIWWKCEKEDDHEWVAAIRDRVRGQGCPCCSNKKVVVSNCLLTTHKHLSTEWHPTKNIGLKPTDFVCGSHAKVWWICKVNKKHEWRSSIKHRTNGGGCPFCKGHRVDKSNSLADCYPLIAKQWDYTKNNGIKPEDVVFGSKLKIWWKCNVNENHKWVSTVRHRTITGTECPYCSNKKVDISNCLATTHPELAKQWNYRKNGILKPTDIVFGSSMKIWWKCRINPSHEWKASIASRSRLGSTCPYCSNKKVDISNCLSTTHPDLTKEWHPIKNGNIRPEDVVSRSNKKIWWKCPAATDHEWAATINNRVSGNGCPCCRGRKVVLSNCVAITHPHLLLEHDKNNATSLYNVTSHSIKKMIWICDKGHPSYLATPYSRIHIGSGCPVCRESHGEKKIAGILSEYGITFSRYVVFPECKYKKPLPFDFVIYKNGKAIAAIEYQGQQHYLPTSFGSRKISGQDNLKLIKKRDAIKLKWCRKNGIVLLRISYKNKAIKKSINNLIYRSIK